VQVFQRRVGHRLAVTKRHELTASLGEHFFGVEIRRAHYGQSCRQGIGQCAAGDLIFARIGRHEYVASLQMLHQVGHAQKPVDESHMVADAQLVGHSHQAGAIDFPFLPFDQGMRGADDQVQRFGTGGHNLRHGLNHVLEPLAAVDQPKSANRASVGEAKLCSCEAIPFERNLGHAMRNHVYPRPRHAIDLRQQPGRHFGHHDNALAARGNLLDQSPWQRVRLGE